MYPFERFTERAKKVLTLAQSEAQRMGHKYIGTEHLLLGLLMEGEGLAATALRGLGVELERVREHIGAALGEAQASATRQIVPTARVKKVIELSFEEARASGHNYVGTEHLLVGLLAEGEGLAARALAEQGVTLDGARAEIDRLAGQAATEPPGRPPGGGEPAMSPEVAGLLSRARMRAAAGQSRSIRLEHLLEAIGDGAGGGAVRALLDLQAARARKAKGMAEQPEHAAEEHAGEERRLEEAFQQALAAWQETLKAPPGEPPPS